MTVAATVGETERTEDARPLDYGAALNEAFVQLMTEDPKMVLIGQGLDRDRLLGELRACLAAPEGADA